jgi:hypothetical protein
MLMMKKTHRLPWLMLAAFELALASASSAQAQELQGCEAASGAQARALAEKYSQQADYQRAGQCYRAAGQYERGDYAFVRAVEPAASETSQRFVQNRDEAKAQIRRLQSAFQKHH